MNANKTQPRLSLSTLVERETKTATQNLAVRSGVRAGGGGLTWGKFAKY